MNNLRPRIKEKLIRVKKIRRTALPLFIGALAILGPVIYLTTRNTQTVQAAEQVSISTTASQITVSIANRYNAVLQKGDTDDFLVIADRSEDDAAPDNTYDFKSPCITASSVIYCLRDDENRQTLVMEATSTSVKVRVIGRFANEASTGYLLDSNGASILVTVDYTFTPDGIYVKNYSDFQAGITLDADTAHNGYEWLGIIADVTDAAFDDTGNIIYGDGTTESTTTTDAAEFEDTNKYVVLPGNGTDTYQDAFVGIFASGWYDDTGGVDEWHWDENISGTEDQLTTQEQNYTTTGTHTAQWFFLLMNEDDLDTEAEREMIINQIRNPDTLVAYDNGSAGTDFDGDAYNKSEAAYMWNMSNDIARYSIDGSTYNRRNPSYILQGYRKDSVPDSLSTNGSDVGSDNYNMGIKPLAAGYYEDGLLFYSTLDSSGALSSPEVGTGGSWGATAATAKYSNGILVNGNNDDSTIPMSGNMLSAEGAISFWYREDGSAQSNGAFFNSTAGSGAFVLRKQASASDLDFTIGSQAVFTASVDVFDGELHHILVTWDDDTTDTRELYIDGILQGTDNTSFTGPTIGSNNLILGLDHDGAGFNIDGVIDDFKIYDNANAQIILGRGGDTDDADEYFGDASNDYTIALSALDGSNRGDYIYFGSEYEFTGLNINLATKGIASGNNQVEWEYWNGTSWSSLTVTESDLGVNQFTNDGSISFTAPGDWGLYSFRGEAELYFIRAYMSSGSFATSPVEDTITTDILKVQHFDTITTDDVVYKVPGDSDTADQGKGSEPVSVWLLDDGSGSTAQDTTTRNNDLTVTNATWQSSSSEQYLQRGHIEFDGTGDLLSDTDDGDYNFGTGGFTFMGSFRIASAPAGTYAILSHYGTAGYKVYMNSSGYLCFGIDDDNTWNPDDEACSTRSFADGNWHTFAAVKDDTTSITLYVDNDQVAQDSSISATGTLNTSSTFYLGMDSDGSSNDLNGDLDNIYMYAHARSQEQIWTDTTTPQTTAFFGNSDEDPADANIISWWRFDEGTGQTVYDAGSAGNDGNRGTTSGSESSDPTLLSRTNCNFTGACLDFDGSDDVVTITSDTTISLSSGLASENAFSAWVYVQSDGESNVGQIFQKGTNTYLRTTNESGGFVDLEGSLALASSNATLSLTAVVPINEWVHVAMSYTDDADDEITIWINGADAGTSTNGSGSPSADSNNLLIGGSTAANFDGYIDDFKVLDIEPTNAQMATLARYNSSALFGTSAEEKDNIVDGDGGDPTGYWAFNENTGSTASDSSGNEYISDTFTGNVDWVKGIKGSALYFDGTDDVVRIPEGTNIDFGVSDSFTLSAWFKTDNDYTTNNAQILGKFANSSNYYLIYMTTAELVCFTIYDNSTFPEVCSTDTLNDGEWHQVTAVRDRTSTNLYLYIDGILVDSTTDTTSVSFTNNDNYSIGNGGVSPSYTQLDFLGSIDEAKVFDYALTPAQVAYEYNRGEPYAWYKFDECSNTTNYDATGLGNNATLTIGTSGSNTSAGSCGSLATDESWANGYDGRYNSSLSLDGTDDYSVITDTANLRFDSSSQDFSIMGWIKRDASGSNHYLISKEDADNDGYYLMVTSGNVVQCGLNSTDITGTTTIADTNWHHIACTFDRSGTGYLYIDGREDASTSVSGITLATTSNIYFGRRSYTSAGYLDGQADDIKIFNYMLSAQQVRQQMNFGNTSFGFN